VEQTGQSDAIHSPQEWASMVISLMAREGSSIAVICTTAISCFPGIMAQTPQAPVKPGIGENIRDQAGSRGGRSAP
jgi:hypothetical protein